MTGSVCANKKVHHSGDMDCRFGILYSHTGCERDGKNMMIINKIALALAIVGCVNWGLVGLFSFDAVAWITGGAGSILARIIYTLVAVAGLWCINLLFTSDVDYIGDHA